MRLGAGRGDCRGDQNARTISVVSCGWAKIIAASEGQAKTIDFETSDREKITTPTGPPRVCFIELSGRRLVLLAGGVSDPDH